MNKYFQKKYEHKCYKKTPRIKKENFFTLYKFDKLQLFFIIIFAVPTITMNRA